MNVVASSPEGLEKSLAEEISNLGGFILILIKDLLILNVILKLFIEFIFIPD